MGKNLQTTTYWSHFNYGTKKWSLLKMQASYKGSLEPLVIGCSNVLLHNCWFCTYKSVYACPEPRACSCLFCTLFRQLVSIPSGLIKTFFSMAIIPHLFIFKCVHVYVAGFIVPPTHFNW